MELKDVVLSTLAEMEENEEIKEDLHKSIQQNIQEPVLTSNTVKVEENIEDVKKEEVVEQKDDELHFLTSVRERLLVLFEGFQAPNNKEIEAKIDMTLNFLEYTLATIDKRVEKIQKGNR